MRGLVIHGGITGKMTNRGCRMPKIQGATAWAAVDLKFDGWKPSPLERRFAC